MQTELDVLLTSIDPDKTIVETYNRANEAINTFDIQVAVVREWDTFRYYMAEFLRHLDYCILHLREPAGASSDYYWQRCSQILNKIYNTSGQKAAFEMARTGNESGFYGVLKAVAMRVAQDYSQNEIRAKVSTFLSRLSVDQRIAASNEYIAKYGRLLPSELTEGSAARIHADFHKVLQEHPQVLLKLRETGR